MSLQPVILSGGSGTRLWPLSREAYPKQFIPLTSKYSMLQETVRRLDGLESEHPKLAIKLCMPLIVCNDAHQFLVAEQLRLIGRHANGIILEPQGRNTAPALTLAALAATQDGSDPVLIVMPADHMIRNEVKFRNTIIDAYLLAQKGAVVTFGIVPIKAETGYGYIRQGAEYSWEKLQGKAYCLGEFVEKPDEETASRYLAAREYLWNSGIFVLKGSLWLELIQRLRPELFQTVLHAFTNGTRDREFIHLNPDLFAACPSDSIDYAVMEPLAQLEKSVPSLIVLPLDVGWSDVGAWSALWEVREQDSTGNVLEGDAFVHNAKDNLLIAHHRMLAAIGVHDLIIIETPDAVLIAAKECSQDVRAVTQFLQRERRNEYRHHQRVHRPWGSYESIGHGARYQVKRLIVQPGESLSLQMHHHRAEHWIVVSGTARVTCEERTFLLTENQSTYIPVGSQHRLENPGNIPLELIEVQSGPYLGEDDIVRFEDRYNRNHSL